MALFKLNYDSTGKIATTLVKLLKHIFAILINSFIGAQMSSNFYAYFKSYVDKKTKMKDSKVLKNVFTSFVPASELPSLFTALLTNPIQIFLLLA